MILQALTRYYQILADESNSPIAPFGYSEASVSFALNLSKQGKLLDVFPLFEQVPRGRRSVEVSQRMLVPEQQKKSVNIAPNFLSGNSAYVLGLADKGKKPDYATKRFEAFREFNLRLLEKANCAEAKAVKGFLRNYAPKKGKEILPIKERKEELLGPGNLVFMVNDRFAHEVPEIRQIWEAYKTKSASQTIGQCLVTGDVGPIARLHGNIIGVKGTNTSGGALVSFNERAYESFGRVKGQGMNSPTSEKVAFAYTTALNYLLSRKNPNRKFTMGDTTVVYWAEIDDNTYSSVFQGLFAPDWIEESEEDKKVSRRSLLAEQRMREIADKVRRGDPLDVDNLLKGLNLDLRTRFYVLGLAPNAARVSVRFFLRDPFGKFVERIKAHYDDMSIAPEYGDQEARITPWYLEKETVSQKATDKSALPLLAGAVMRAILNNTPYPAVLYNAIINRIRADMDDGKTIRKINRTRAAAIKGFLKRKYRNQSSHPIQEVLTMSLNAQSTNQAYLLGRLFAVLEGLQRSAAKPAKLNATIKDRYFTSACASPATVFPVLLRLSQHHISKAGWGDKQIGGIMNLLDVDNRPFPTHLALDEQGVFVLGYYHERAAFFSSKQIEDETREVETVD